VRINQVCGQLHVPTYADDASLPAFTRRTPLLRQSIDISCPPDPHQQTSSSGFAAVGQPVGRTHGLFHTDFAPHTAQAAAVSSG